MDDYTNVMKVYRPEATYFYDMITRHSILTNMKCKPVIEDFSETLHGFVVIKGNHHEHWITLTELTAMLEKLHYGCPYRGVN